MINCLSEAWDDATGMMGRCVKALVVTEPVADVKPNTSSNAQFRDDRQLVAWYSATLQSDKDDVKFFLGSRGGCKCAMDAALPPFY